ncbi:MAG TPA: hypothetical protein VGK38_02140, partial [Prolixibacteraceae bacterium]
MREMINIRKIISSILMILSIYLLCSFVGKDKTSENLVKDNDQPKIVNIVNFIRLLEPRDAQITEEVLYQTVVKQVEIMKKYKLRGTFLLQYD